MDRSEAAATVATLTPKERHLFKQCRRAWDLEAGGRRNLEPIVSSEPFDVDRCVRDALAVYYYPGMRGLGSLGGHPAGEPGARTRHGSGEGTLGT